MRLRRLSSVMLQEYPFLWNLEETGDVLNEAVIRLTKALERARPQCSPHFFNLAAQHIRWQLQELVRRYRGRDGKKARHLTNQDITEKPRGLFMPLTDRARDFASLDWWTKFHEEAAMLPDKEKAVFELLFYEALTQEEAAEVLDVNVRTVKRLWSKAKRKLAE